MLPSYEESTKNPTRRSSLFPEVDEKVLRHYSTGRDSLERNSLTLSPNRLENSQNINIFSNDDQMDDMAIICEIDPISKMTKCTGNKKCSYSKHNHRNCAVLANHGSSNPIQPGSLSAMALARRSSGPNLKLQNNATGRRNTINTLASSLDVNYNQIIMDGAGGANENSEQNRLILKSLLLLIVLVSVGILIGVCSLGVCEEIIDFFRNMF